MTARTPPPPASAGLTGIDAALDLQALAHLLGDDPAAGILARLVASGRIARDASGRVPLAEAVPVFFDTLRADLRAMTATAAAERARGARAEAAELRLSEARRDLVPGEDAEGAVDALCGEINASFAALPARVTRDPRARRRVDEIARAAQAALARDLTGAA